MSQPRSRVSRTNKRRQNDMMVLSSESMSQSSETGSDEIFCIICAEKIVYSAIAPCNNVTCHVCAFRQRALYKKKTCLVCRTDHDDIIFSEAVLEEVKFADFVAQSRSIYSQDYDAHFTSQYVKDDTLKLMSYECSECQENFKRLNQLNDHTKSEHSMQFCDICIAHGNTFICELTLFSQRELQRHKNEGDRTGFTGHPKCKFCRGKRFYSEDELNIHIRDSHERCYICNQDNYQISDYYRNYDDLYDHFRTSHYVCTIPSCVEKRFVVFREDLDLTAHMLKEHGGIMGQSGRLVIGATSSSFQSQLSTFNSRSSNNKNNSRETNDYSLKKRRLDERVKHYLRNDSSKMGQFEKLNANFKSKRISAADLVKQYQVLFEINDDEEVALVLYEFIELQPSHSDQRASLQLAFDQMSTNGSAGSSARSFPVLGNTQNRHILRNSSWGAGIGSSKKSLDDQFPALVKPAKAKPVPALNGQVKYTVLKKKPTASPRPAASNNTFKENTSYRPSYLENSRSESSINSLPRLGSSTSSMNNSSASSREGSRPQSPVIRGPISKLPDAKFPALASKKKITIPPVKPIPKAPTGWGPSLVRQEPEPKNDWGIKIVDKKAEKLRRKAERAESKSDSKK